MTERNIYEYQIGQERRFGDPLAILRAFVAACQGEQATLIRQSYSEVPSIAAPAQTRLLAAARTAFGMGAFDAKTGAGSTDEEVFSVLQSFFDWLAKKKIPVAHWPMFRLHTDSPTALNTETSSVSGSTSQESISSVPA